MSDNNLTSIADIIPDFYIDPEVISNLYKEAFKDIEFPDNWGVYSEGKETTIEDRAPGSAITAKIWNDTVNELRNICRAVAQSMHAYNEGVDGALQEFVSKINEAIRTMIEENQEQMLRFLTESNISIDGSFVDVDTNTCYIEYTLTVGDISHTVRSGNLRGNQIFWLVTDDEETTEPEPVDDQNNPVWRVKIDTSAEALGNTLITDAALAAYNFLPRTEAASTYALKTEVGSKDQYSSLEANDCWTALDEINDKVGAKADGSAFTADTCWGGLDEVRDLCPTQEDMEAIDDLLAFTEDIDEIDSTLESLREDTDANAAAILTLTNKQASLITQLNTNLKKINNALAGLQAMAYREAWSSLASAGNYKVVSTNANGWKRVDYVNFSNPLSLMSGYTTNSTSTTYNKMYASKCAVSMWVRGGYCTIYMNLYFGPTSKKIGEVINSKTVMFPIIEIPEWARPWNSFDIPCHVNINNLYTANMAVGIPGDSAVSYVDPSGATKSYTKPTIMLYNLTDGTNGHIAIPSINGGFYVKAKVTYPVLGYAQSITDGSVSTAQWVNPIMEADINV